MQVRKYYMIQHGIAEPSPGIATGDREWAFSMALEEKLQTDFEKFAGVAPWMWPMMSFQVLMHTGMDGFAGTQARMQSSSQLVCTHACTHVCRHTCMQPDMQT
jgi:hypothetical protein